MLCDSVSKMDTLTTHPLWRFALAIYPQAKPDLLHWQDAYGVHVNDLLWLAYARSQDQRLDIPLWARIEQGRPRQLLRRVRRVRYKLDRDDPIRESALEWELGMEQIDLALLSECLHPQGMDWRIGVGVIARHWQLDESQVAGWANSLVTLWRT